MSAELPQDLVRAAPIDTKELAAWLRLLETPGVGRLGARRLLSRFGSPQEIFLATQRDWQQACDASLAQALAQQPKDFEALLARTQAWLAEDTQRSILTLGDAAYPNRLLELSDPPLLLYACGNLAWLHAPAIAIVGSRHASPQGLENAHQFGAELSQAGWVVVSGLAAGIDGAAHEGALTGPCGTVAVVGTGLDRVYPARHHSLGQRIAQHGLLLSEFPLGTPPLAAHFPQRNRIIAGLGAGTLVVEAALASGSLITARLAGECGREVFAVPGTIHNPQARGCHALIKQGAKLVESCQDVLEELLPGRVAQLILGGMDTTIEPPDEEAPAQSEALMPEASHPILQALGFEPATLDTLQLRTGLSAAELSVALLDLELAAQVERLPGQIFRRLVRM
jgi:DNA processing protein